MRIIPVTVTLLLPSHIVSWNNQKQTNKMVMNEPLKYREYYYYVLSEDSQHSLSKCCKNLETCNKYYMHYTHMASANDSIPRTEHSYIICWRDDSCANSLQWATQFTTRIDVQFGVVYSCCINSQPQTLSLKKGFWLLAYFCNKQEWRLKLRPRLCALFFCQYPPSIISYQ